ncbi:hypothetical protein [Bdellovibrio sp. HCB337]|uniref:hypothetical protein n=1 Tax=Bdellovibrio sp. HCB337 TaxID=3394358 RepID=UPI0039A5AF41
MKNLKLMSLVLLAAPLFAQAEIRENGGFIVPAATQINFFSPGNGIDHALKDKVDALIQRYKDAGLITVHTEKHYGFEGETLVCVEISDINASRKFNVKVEKLIKKGQRKTNLEYLSSCDPVEVAEEFLPAQ